MANKHCRKLQGPGSYCEKPDAVPLPPSIQSKAPGDQQSVDETQAAKLGGRLPSCRKIPLPSSSQCGGRKRLRTRGSRNCSLAISTEVITGSEGTEIWGRVICPGGLARMGKTAADRVSRENSDENVSHVASHCPGVGLSLH